MFKSRKLVGVVAGAVLAVAGMASAASALTVTINNPNAGDSFSATVSALQLTASIGTVRCNVTLNGTISDGAYPITGTQTIGSITSGSVSGCSPAVTVTLNRFPWSITADAASVLTGTAGLYQININNPNFTLLGVNFIANALAARTNGTTLNLNQPATVVNANNSALTGNLGAQTWNIGPSPISITG